MNYKTPNRAHVITYWITTSLVIFELLYGATWDFNLLNKRYVGAVMEHLGYPIYLPFILGTSKIIAAVCIGFPKLTLIKEWAYTGVMIMFLGALCSHIIVGDGISTIAFLSVCIGLTITSYCFRPNSRRVMPS